MHSVFCLLENKWDYNPSACAHTTCNWSRAYYQGHSRWVWSGQVHSACVSTLQLGESGACSPRKCLEFRGYEIASIKSEIIFGLMQCFSEARRQSFTCMNIYPFCNISPVCLGGLHGHPPSNGANWWCQSSYGWGKVVKWSGLIGPVATALSIVNYN